MNSIREAERKAQAALKVLCPQATEREIEEAVDALVEYAFEYVRDDSDD